MKPLELVAINGGKHYPLTKDLVIIGRQDVCDVHIDHKSVSKQHCILLVRGNKLWLRDLGSTNGCHVNGKRVRRSQVQLSDIVGIAGFNFRVKSGEVKKSKSETPGTVKLNPDELKRLEQGIAKDGSRVPTQSGPMVQVNTLPDEYTPVADDEEQG